MKNLRKTFFGSVVSLLICFTMLLGTTFAWFTDSVSSTGNVIMSGTLDVDVLHLVDGAYVSLSEGTNHKVFNYDLWEPGYTQVETLKIKNNGNLALRYQMTVFAEDGTEVLGANNENLADKIEVYMCFGESTATSAADLADTTKWWSMGRLSQYLDGTVFTSGKMLPAGATYNGPQLGQDGVMIGECVASIALHMSEDAGNEYQNLSLGNVYISLVATQWTFEEDSFDDQYDVNAWDELLCDHTNTTQTTTYNKTATGHTAVTTEKCNDCHAVISTTTGTEADHVDTNADNVCDVCGYAMTPVTPAHTHSEKWAQDPTGETHTSYCDTNDCDGTFVATINEACADGNDADNLCDKCGRDLTPAVCNHVDANHDGACDLNCGETGLAVSHDGETINYTPNYDGTHNGDYACGVTAVTNEACDPADGVCDKCGANNTPVVPAVTTLVSYDFGNYHVTTNQWQNHFGGHDELSVVDGRLHLEKTDQNILYSLWTILPTLTEGETYTISADIYLCDNEYIDGNSQSQTLDSANFTAFVKFNNVDGKVLAKSERVTVAYGVAETVTFTYTPCDDTSAAVLSFNMDGDSWGRDGISFCIDNVKVTVEGDDATVEHSYDLNCSSNSDGTHNGACCICNQIITTNEACSDPDWDGDTLCDKCGYDMTL